MQRIEYRWAGSLLGLLCLLALAAPVNRLQAQTAAPVGPPASTTVATPPPPFDPAQLGPDQPLAGSDYPAVTATPAPAAGPAAASSGGRPDGIDLDVLYIERTPKYARYTVIYQDGAPLLQPGTENAQRWPAPGETVTFAAHVMNKGMQPSDSFAVAWYIDGQLVKTDVGPDKLWPNMEAVFELQWVWNHRLAGERLLDAHTVRFVVDPGGLITESFETNNTLEDRTDALALEVAVAPQTYAALDNQPRLGGAFSAEDWLQRHVRALNGALADSIYRATPDGVGVRVRIDKIRIAWVQPLVDPGYDGGWFVNDDYRQTSTYYHADTDLDWGMLHEWGHQLGLIDAYRYWVAPATVDVRRQDGGAVGLGYDFPGDGLMETVVNLPLDEFNAAGLQATQGYRRGYYGEYQFDLAPTIVLALRDAAGCPVPDAAIAFYQRNAAMVGEPDEARRIDSQAEFTGLTGADGRLALPNRPSGGSQRTATGYTLRDNPFGRIEVGGSGNIGLLRLQKAGREQFAWLTVADLNLAYWRQGRPAVQEMTLTWEGAGNCAPTPTLTPAPPTPTAEPTAAPTTVPTTAPTATPTAAPTAVPTAAPTTEPTVAPTAEPTAAPTTEPTAAPTIPTEPTEPLPPTPTTPAPVSTPVVPPGAPAAPHGLAVAPAGQDAGDSALLLTWQSAGDAEAGYQIEWAAGAADWARLAEVGPDMTAHTVTNLVCGLTYRFRLRAFNHAGASAYSTELVYTAAPCAAGSNQLYLAMILR